MHESCHLWSLHYFRIVAGECWCSCKVPMDDPTIFFMGTAVEGTYMGCEWVQVQIWIPLHAPLDTVSDFWQKFAWLHSLAVTGDWLSLYYISNAYVWKIIALGLFTRIYVTILLLKRASPPRTSALQKVHFQEALAAAQAILCMCLVQLPFTVSFLSRFSRMTATQQSCSITFNCSFCLWCTLVLVGELHIILLKPQEENYSCLFHATRCHVYALVQVSQHMQGTPYRKHWLLLL